MEYMTIGDIIVSIFLAFFAVGSVILLVKSNRYNDQRIKEKYVKEIKINPLSDEMLKERYKKEIKSRKKA